MEADAKWKSIELIFKLVMGGGRILPGGGALFDLATGHREGLYLEIQQVHIVKDNKFKQKGGLPIKKT